MKINDLRVIFGTRDHRQNEDVITRAAAIVPSSLSEETRSVRCCLTTEDPVRVWDWRNGKIVLETLVVGGCEYESQTPLLRDHRQYSVDAILGSVSEHSIERDELVGMLTFGEDLDESSEGIWKRVKQGHLRRVSVGYDYTTKDYITVPAGETQSVAGRSFTAPKDFDLRVVYRWRLREVSVVVIPADQRAQMRSNDTQRGTPASEVANSDLPGLVTDPTHVTRNGPETVNELLRFLRSHGLPTDTDIADNAAAFAWARAHLAREHYQALHDLVRQHSIDGFVASEFPVERSTTTNPITPTQPQGTPDDGVRQERERQTAIRNLASQHPAVSQDVVNRCLENGDSIDQARSAFLDAIRSSQSPTVPALPPAAHIRGGITLQSLQAGLLARCGIEPDSPTLASPVAENVFGRNQMQAGWLRGAARSGQSRDTVEAAFDAARNQRLSGGSFIRFCEALVELDGQRAPWNEDELIERAFSSGNFAPVFGAVVHLMMVQGFVETPATYQEFCRMKDVPDFRPNKEAHTNGVGRLKKQGINGGEAALLNIDDPTIAQVAAERYAGMLVVSDQVIINDSFDVLDSLPREVGISARQIPGDLAYSVVLGNPDMSDSAKLYVDGTNWITSGSLDEAGLNAATKMLKTQKIGQKRITVTEAVLLHGTTLSLKAKKLLTSTTSPDFTDNVMRNSYRRVEDTAIDLGVANPAADDAEIAGKPDSYFLFGEPRRSIVMAFRRGTNRGPITRTGRLPIGQFGQAWDVIIDVGVAAASRIGTVRVDIAAEAEE